MGGLEELDPEEEYEGWEYAGTGESCSDTLLEFGLERCRWGGASYDGMYWSVYENLEDVEYTTEDVERMVLDAATADLAFETSMAVKGFGLYTGLLLDVLAERKHERGERLRIHVNGGGHRLDYLFFGTRKVDELYVENMVGDMMLRDVGRQGQVDVVVGKELVGDGVMSRIGGEEIGPTVEPLQQDPDVGLVVASDVTGRGICGGMVYETIDAVLYEELQEEHWDELQLGSDVEEQDNVVPRDGVDGIYREVFEAVDRRDWDGVSELAREDILDADG